jgi:hypothetical protein
MHHQLPNIASSGGHGGPKGSGDIAAITLFSRSIITEYHKL